MFQGNSARTSLVNSARMCLAKSATTFPDRSAETFLDSSARTSLASSAATCRPRSATTCQGKFATTFLASSASKFPSKCATPPSQPTVESEDLKRELMKTRNQDAAEELPEAPKRRFNLLSKLPGWSQRPYLFLLCNIYGILVNPRVLSRVNKKSGVNISTCKIYAWIIFSDQLKIGRFRSHDDSLLCFRVCAGPPPAQSQGQGRKNLGAHKT